jgi:hypothetical protein
MFTFIKKLFGFDQPTMKEAGVQLEQAPYKVEVPPEPITPSPQCSDSVTQPDGNECKTPAPEVTVEAQITDAVTQTPAKKTRAPKAEKSTTKKAALVKKAAAIKATTKARTSRSKKA